MELILNLPMIAQDFATLPSTHASATDKIAYLLTSLPRHRSLAVTHAHGLESLPLVAIAYPRDVMNRHIGALFLATMIRLNRRGVVLHILGRQSAVKDFFDRGLNVVEQVFLVLFDHQD